MKPFDNLVEKLRQELIGLAHEKESLRNEELVWKSQELDEILNIFYAPMRSGAQDCTAYTCKTVEEIITAALYKKGLTSKDYLSKVEKLCYRIGKKLNLSQAKRNNLHLLAIIHNVGMLVIPDRILFKKEPLTDKELLVIRRHPENGFRIAIFLGDLSGIADLILKHHEHWDGSGYPRGLMGEKIPVESRICTIVEAYYAMISDKHYRRALKKEEALAELKRCAGSQFDPGLVEIFCDLLN